MSLFYSCPVDPNIFPRFREIGSSLESSYEAFRFTESYGVIFQCNVKYCIGKCEPVSMKFLADRNKEDTLCDSLLILTCGAYF